LENLPLEAWLALFAVAALFVVLGGIGLAKSADAITEQTSLGAVFVGALLVGGATSLPELATNVSAAAAGTPDLAVANVFGANMANMATLALINLVFRGRVWANIKLGQVLIAAIAISLMAVAVIGIALPNRVVIGWVGAETIVIVVLYILAMNWSRRAGETLDNRTQRVGEIMAPEGPPRHALLSSPLRAGLAFAASAGIVLVAAPLLAISAGGIAETAGIAQTIIGAIMLAIATSLPELVTAFTAVRIGAYDLAVGNLFGSAAFNMTILAAADLAYADGPILGAVGQNQIVTGAGAIFLLTFAMAALLAAQRRKIGRLEPNALILLAAYVVMLGAVGLAGG
jgi:cation:H+ antiporter